MKSEGKNDWIVLLCVFAVVVGGWLATWYFLTGMDDRGTFGDMFGFINSIFSGLAFGGVIWAILLQSRELKLQREELKLTRDELRGQKLALKKQNFESTFFQLLRLHHDIINGIDLFRSRDGMTIKGRDCFKVFYERFERKLAENKQNYSGKTGKDRINNTYCDFYKCHQSEVGHYFRNLYNIIKLIENSDLEDKKLYTNLVRAQLSSFELALLFYNALSDKGVEKFKPLIEKYSLLKTLPADKLLLEEDHLFLYAKSAYE